MSAQAKPSANPMLIHDFVAWMNDWSPAEKFELLDGQPVAMAGGAIDNDVIAQNIVIATAQRLRERGCRALRDVLVRSSESDRFGAFPDVHIRCGPMPDGRQTWIDDPVAVFEVLSPSTIAIDRGYKQQQYLAMPTLQHYALIHPREFRVEVWSRDETGSWSDFPASAGTAEAVVTLSALGLSLAMADIYADTDLIRTAAP